MLRVAPLALILFAYTYAATAEECNFSNELVKEIQSYKSIVEKIVQFTTNGTCKGRTYRLLAEWVDKFGSRLVGTQNLENSIDYLIGMMKNNKITKIYTENATVPHWERNLEICEMVHPRKARVPILALGTSVSTPEDGIEAEVIVVNSFSDLINNYNSSVKGKIVVFNYNYTTYWKQVNYRIHAPFIAAKYGAVAALIRSVTPFSLRTLHTGMTHYRRGYSKIPAVAITIEDAHLFQRYQDRGIRPILKLNVQTTTFPDTPSRNVIAEVPGTKSPEKVVIMSGHSDSWDVGAGVMDDAAGAFVSWLPLVVLNLLDLKPRRTVRSITWVSEENRLSGAKQYFLDHKHEFDNFMLMMESDEGTFTPTGLTYLAGNKGGCILQEVMKLLAPINATEAVKEKSVGADIEIWNNIIPCGSLRNQNDKYFWFHHTEADTLDVENTNDLDKAVALFTSVSYIIADLESDFPRD